MPAAAILGASVVGAGASIISGNKAAKAADRATEANNQLLQQQYNQTRSDLNPYTQLGYGAGNALQQRLGLGGGGGAAAGGSSGGGYDSYLAANPDLAAEAQRVTADGEFGSVGDYLKWHDSQYANEGRASYTDPVTGQPTSDAGYQAPGEDLSWQTAERPTYGAAPSFSDFYDPNPTQQYKDELTNSTKSINARAGATQGYYSGARAKGLEANANQLWNADDARRRQNALGLYQTALGQYNTDRSVGNQQFDSDRGFGASRYDTNTGNLFNLLGIGANATQSLAGYGAQNANALAGNNTANAGAKANSYINTGNQIGNVLGQAAGAYGLYGGGSQYGQPNISSMKGLY